MSLVAQGRALCQSHAPGLYPLQGWYSVLPLLSVKDVSICIKLPRATATPYLVGTLRSLSGHLDMEECIALNFIWSFSIGCWLCVKYPRAGNLNRSVNAVILVEYKW